MGTVYFIQPCGLSRIKIGYSENTDVRYRGYTTECPAPIHVALELEGDASLEFELQDRFARDWYYGEWFDLSADMADFIADRGGSLAPSYEKPNNECGWCGAVFVPRSGALFCSGRCKIASHNAKRVGHDGPASKFAWCICGRSFHARGRASHYCSPACRQRRNLAVERGLDGPVCRVGWCRWCGDYFKSRVTKDFCSSACSQAMNYAARKGFDGPASPVSWCSWCSSQMRPERHGQDYCDTACRNAFNNHKNRAAA